MVDGIINVYKEAGYTSHDVVAKLRSILKQKKIGHTGTLDPEAEGVLPVCLGKGTKLCEYLTDHDKTYEAVLLLGQATDTQDLTGAVLHTMPVCVTEEEVRTAIQSFVGEYGQVPPMYSALKVKGRKLCDLARAGIEVERKSRRVKIYEIRILEIALPEVRMEVSCSKGTYIRTLCADIGEKLGCYGCMASLKRTRVDRFRIEDSYTLAQVEQLWKSGQLSKIVMAVDEVFASYPAVTLGKEAGKIGYNGNPFSAENLLEASATEPLDHVRVYDHRGVFIGVYRYDGGRELFWPVKMFYVPN